MSTLIVELEIPGARAIEVTDGLLTAQLIDGRTISVPLAWYPRLLDATPRERDNRELHNEGQHIQWPDLDEDLSVEMLMAGIHSGESSGSFQRWLRARRAGLAVTIHEISSAASEEV